MPNQELLISIVYCQTILHLLRFDNENEAKRYIKRYEISGPIARRGADMSRGLHRRFTDSVDSPSGALARPQEAVFTLSRSSIEFDLFFFLKTFVKVYYKYTSDPQLFV